MTDNPKISPTLVEPEWVKLGYGARFQMFQNLMQHRIRDVLLVSSLYDLYVFEEDGRLYELIRDKYHGLNLTHAPELIRASDTGEALTMLESKRPFDLVITTLHIDDMRPHEFASKVKALNPDIPIVLLAFDNKELSELMLHHNVAVFDQIYIWQGDFRLMLAIIKSLEDRMNVAHDTQILGVQSIILIEDNISYYSSFLPMIFLEVMKHTQRLISEGINLSHKRLRMRARPKILLCTNYDEAWQYYKQYDETILGIISDIDFPKGGEKCPGAGLEFAKAVKVKHPDIPILLNSTNVEFQELAEALNLSFILKNSPTLMQELRTFLMDQLSFGDFVFMTPDGREVGRATDLKTLEEQIFKIPDESFTYHAERNHFSNWLKARTEFWLAHELRPRKLSDFPSIEATRHNLARSIGDYRAILQRGSVTDFNQETFDPASSISRIGGGALGGKARGLNFINTIVNHTDLCTCFPGVEVVIPPAIMIGTDVFDDFLEANHLLEFALNETDDEVIHQRFLDAAVFPEEIKQPLRCFLEIIRSPLAVRSSSLLEDSHNHPFAGVYSTFMLPNTGKTVDDRLQDLIAAIKRVYASTFLKSAKDYMKATSFRLEEEKMAVIIQKMAGAVHGTRFYPHFSGVARSYNFYPVPPQKFSDGVAAIALGLGKTVVEGGAAVRFCPHAPSRIEQFSTMENILKSSQTEFYALDLSSPVDPRHEIGDAQVKKYPLQAAEEDGALAYVASTYSPENDRLYDGISRDGLRVITFANILKNKQFPLNDILIALLEIGRSGMGTPVEIEFATDLADTQSGNMQFALLQIRPMVVNRELEMLNIEAHRKEDLICYSSQILGNGVMDHIHDIVFVDRTRFERSKSRDAAQEIARINAKLVEEDAGYILIGVGRWGSLDPWLGIPVSWDQIAGAKLIVESDFMDFTVDPSQGSHFFQNLNSFMIGYFTVHSDQTQSGIDWNWLLEQPVVESTQYVRHVHFDKPLIVKMSAHQNKGIVLKPGL